MDELVLAADLGGTNLRLAAVGRDGSIRHRARCATPRDDDPMSIVRSIGALAAECQQAAGETPFRPVIGVAAPATMDVSQGLIHYAPNLLMLNGFRFSDALSKTTGLRVVLENDATAAAIGEHWLGASCGIANSVCVTLGTGVGSGIILDHKPLRGPDGTAGELGHVCVEPEGHPCGCGSKGCLEQYASATAVVRTATELAAGSAGSVLSGLKSFSSKDVYEAALQGDAVAIESFRRMGYYLGIALAGLVNLLNPEAIVLGGGLSSGWDMFISETRSQIAKRAFREPAERVKLVRAELGDDAGILGVTRLAVTAPDQGILES